MSARTVTAVVRFRAGPGREREAAEAWAFELTYYFLRGVGEQPQVTYAGGVYTCTGLMTTSHPGDADDVTVFESTADLDFCMAPDRQKLLRDLYPARGRFDGRSEGSAGRLP